MLWSFREWVAAKFGLQGSGTIAYGTGTTQCPYCGVPGTYNITMSQGGQVISCGNCRKNFTAEVDHGQFTGKTR